MKKEKYYFATTPIWVEKLSDENLLELTKSDSYTLNAKKIGKNICYTYQETVKTSNTSNESYVLRAWELNSPELLQFASISEFEVQDNEYINIHNISIVRDGKIINKNKDVNLRILDNEQSSSQGVINNLKKINCIVNDLRLNDIFVFEYSLITEFTEENFLDKKYFRYLRYLPIGDFFYKQYLLKVINARKEDLSICKMYFRNNDNVRLPDELTTLKCKENFIIDKVNYQQDYNKDEFSAYIEVATKTTWQEISTEISELYQKKSRGDVLSESNLPTDIRIANSGKDIEDKIGDIIKYVQNEIVYLYDAQVMHGHIPESALKTLSIKSGDCKAKSLLLVSLLKIIGIKAELILVNYSQDYFIPKYLPSPFVFNHAIVKIEHQDKSYFVDPTCRDRCGSITYRSEPYFYNFLPTREGTDLEKRSITVLPLSGINQDIQIKLKNDLGSIRIETIHYGESADATRNFFLKNPLDRLLNYYNSLLFDRLSYPQIIQTDELLKKLEDVKFKIVSDDKSQNKIVTLYECNLKEPYQMAGKYKVFKFYHHLDINPILKHSHKDYPSTNFIGDPSQYILNIETDQFIFKSDPILKRETVIDNAYFTFSNKKNVEFKKINVTSIFTPKRFGYITPEDLEKTKKDYIEINQSNFGVGAVFMDFSQFLLAKRYWLIAAYLAVHIIGYLLSR